MHFFEGRLVKEDLKPILVLGILVGIFRAVTYRLAVSWLDGNGFAWTGLGDLFLLGVAANVLLFTLIAVLQVGGTGMPEGLTREAAFVAPAALSAGFLFATWLGSDETQWSRSTMSILIAFIALLAASFALRYIRLKRHPS